MSSKTTIMVVDDSIVIRGILRRMITAVPDFEIVGDASDGEMAIEKLKNFEINKRPDVIILDLQMPKMDGITALPELLKISPRTKIIIASVLSQANAEISLKALDLGACDYLPKPSVVKDGPDAMEIFTHELIEKIRAHGANARRGIKPASAAPAAPTAESNAATISPAIKAAPSAAPKATNEEVKLSTKLTNKPLAIAIGSSTGGPDALNKVFSMLKGQNLSSCPIFITQHMPPHFTKILADNLTKTSGRTCVEAQNGMEAKPDMIFIAPGNYHMVPEKVDGKIIIKINQDAAENFCRPAVDPMLRGLDKIYGRNLLVVMLTGLGADGCKGSQIVYDNGGTIIAQDKETSTVWGMPGAVAKAGICSKVLPLDKVAGAIMEVCK